jgi:hypothetical protein
MSAGFGNYNYLVQEGNNKYVLRIKKGTETQFSDSLEREYIFLKYFTTKGIDFCPQVYYYDKKDKFLLESFLTGTETAQKDLSHTQIDLFAKQLHRMYSLDVSEFSEFCQENQCQEFGYVSPLESLQTYGFARFERARQLGLETEASAWIETRLNNNLSYLETTQDKNQELGFDWGDIQSNVIIGNDGQMFFYDFEHATISNSFGLCYVKIHGSFTETQFTHLVDRCAFYFDTSTKTLIDQIRSEEIITRVNDVVWAAMMWAETNEMKFKKIMEARINLVENI